MRLTSIYSDNAELGVTTIDPYELNCRVRNGNGCCLVGKNISLIPAPLFRELPVTPLALRDDSHFTPNFHSAKICKSPSLAGTKNYSLSIRIPSFTFTHKRIGDCIRPIARAWIKEYGQASRPISTD